MDLGEDSRLVALPLEPDLLGESIGWAENAAELWRVDILGGLVHRVDAPLSANPRQQTEAFKGEVGFALPRPNGGMLVGEEQRLWLVDSSGSRRILLELDERPENRWNDAVCDAHGRLWAGTFARDRQEGEANLYRVEPDGAIERVLRGLTISNGLGWAEGGTRLHFIDSSTQRIDVLDVEVGTGRLGERRPLVEIPRDVGMPDGLCIDANGSTWAALFGGGSVRRYGRHGELEEEIQLPVSDVTNVCLGGQDGTELFMSTARHRLSATDRRRSPRAGCVFHRPVAAPGEPLLAFGG